MNNHFKHTVIASVLSLTAMAAQAQVAIMGANAAPISKDQLANIYLGRSFDLKPVDLPEGSPIREQFYKKATDRDQSQIKAVWSRIVFTGKGQAPSIMADAAAVKKAVQADPKAIGYIDKAAVDGSVKVVFSLD
jgi:ABC-type phosphate transport system substrate-binding protein